MRFQSAPGIDIIAPGLIEQTWNEAEALGGTVWLWMHSPFHRDLPLHTLPAALMPALKNRQFILGIESGKPVFYVSWANLNEEAEQRYVKTHPLLMPQEDWNSGDRMWVHYIVAPFGHLPLLHKLLHQQLFANRCGRFLYHRGHTRGLKIKDFYGKAVLKKEAREWFDTHPVVFA